MRDFPDFKRKIARSLKTVNLSLGCRKDKICFMREKKLARDKGPATSFIVLSALAFSPSSLLTL